MPEPQPSRYRLGSYDIPPSSEAASTPRSRSSQLRRALQNTSDLAREASMTDLDSRPPRRTLLSPINRRRQRSPSEPLDDLTDTSLPMPLIDHSRRRRPKRRRLEADTLATIPPIKYGRFGQVEPGRLRLDLVSCDGGEHMDNRHPTLYLGPKNLLRHDKTVYCSSNSSSNVVLRHADDSPFTLEKLHIVGPEHGFTAPIREGLVYVAMTLQDLDKYIDPPVHARRVGLDTPPYYRNRVDLRSSPERLSLAEALRDPDIDAAHSRRAWRGPGMDSADPDLEARQGSYYGEDFRFGRVDPEAHCEIPSFISDEGPDFITNGEGEHMPVTVISDDEVGSEDISTQEVLEWRSQRLRLMRRRRDLEPMDRSYERWAGLQGLRFAANDNDPDQASSLSYLDHLMARSRMADVPQSREDTPKRGENRTPERTGVELDAEKDDKVTCARFRIRSDKHKVAIKFEPAISGRFILLKLWANKSNVDVQSIIAKGFGGCRYFPAVQAR